MEFTPFPKIPRLNRECVITEKIDGTNAQVYIQQRCSCELDASCNECPNSALAIARSGNLILYAGSRTRWITPENDNYGFAAWVKANAEELFQLGPGQHFGEWWGGKIQRGYGITERRFSLFNTGRWAQSWKRCAAPYDSAATRDPLLDGQQYAPDCCHVVPVLYRGRFDSAMVNALVEQLRENGSVAASGFYNPEGLVVFHVAANEMFKVTLEKDEQPKGRAA